MTVVNESKRSEVTKHAEAPGTASIRSEDTEMESGG